MAFNSDVINSVFIGESANLGEPNIVKLRNGTNVMWHRSTPQMLGDGGSGFIGNFASTLFWKDVTEVTSAVFLQHQKLNVNYYVKKLVRESQSCEQTMLFLLSSCLFVFQMWIFWKHALLCEVTINSTCKCFVFYPHLRIKSKTSAYRRYLL